MTEWDATVDFVIVGSGGGGMVAALDRARCAARARSVLEKQELVGGSTAHVRRGRLGPEQPGDAGRRHPGLLRGRHGPLRGGRRRRRSGLVVRAPARVPRRRAGDGLVPPATWASASSTASATATTTPNAKGGERRGPGDRARARATAGCSATGSPKLQPGLAQSLGLAVHDQRRVRARRTTTAASAPSRSRPGWRSGPRCAQAPDARRCSTNGCVADRPDARPSRSPGSPVWTEAPLDDLIVEDGRVVGVARCASP